ncbi:MAG: hypothetical protein IKX20_06630 [Paludibacteraceae bacterium]|nr:hypothetical protein [Paludibacteraceae bacterium]
MRKYYSLSCLSLLLFCLFSCGNTTSKVKCTAIDLGLPSGNLWADMNLGASAPEENGDFFFWGDVTPCSAGSRYRYIEDSYYTGGREVKYLKYITSNEYGVVDNRLILETTDDAATAMLGDGWTVPTLEDIDELLSCCTWKEVERDGIKGIALLGPNGNSIFLPRPGDYDPLYFNINDNGYAHYWSNSLAPKLSDEFAYTLAVTNTWKGTQLEKDEKYRVHPAMIRPVKHK